MTVARESQLVDQARNYGLIEGPQYIKETASPSGSMSASNETSNVISLCV
jgi:hypothetical protein